ncbi:uncharacterized protein LOC141856701 isoform X2 [Brevipalpus obovatus]|uniref:uncharacterized protein LOC141856701 isoform X2 n=1 Tax=Brevipalpus obovatus TaxID=246614 RepID=UPI003D9EDB4D
MGSSSSMELSEESSDRSSGKRNLDMIVDLRIGEFVFSTTVGTLTKYGSKFKDKLSDHLEGPIELERNGKYFNKILNFLRDGSVPLPKTKEKLSELLVEAEYYRIEELISEIEYELKSIKERTSGLNTLHKTFLMMSPEIYEFSGGLSGSEIRLTIESSDSHLFAETTMEEFVGDFESFSSLCERSNHKLIYTKHYTKKSVKERPSLRWSFISNDEVCNIKKGENLNFHSVLSDFVDLYQKKPGLALENEKVIPSSDQPSQHKGDPREIIKLNVGGSIFRSTRRCLTKYESIFRDMLLEEQKFPIDSEGCRRFDRSGEHFIKILDFLGNETISLPECEEQLAELLAEAKFYKLEELGKVISEKLAEIDRSISNYPCKVFLITSIEDEELLSRSTKPTVKLTIQKISQAIENGPQAKDFWKHLLHFDRFCCFSEGMIQFAQQVTDGTKCLWTFSIDGKVVENYDLMKEERPFKDCEMHEKMVKFLAKVLNWLSNTRGRAFQTKPTVELTIQTYDEAPHMNALKRHHKYFKDLHQLTKGKVEFIKKTTTGASCMWTFSLDSTILAERDFMIEVLRNTRGDDQIPVKSDRIDFQGLTPPKLMR